MDNSILGPTKRSNMMAILRKAIPSVELHKSEDGWSTAGGIHISAESGYKYNDSYIFNQNAWEFDPDEKVYEMGVLVEFNDEVLDGTGWFAEFYDAGTVILWPIGGC